MSPCVSFDGIRLRVLPAEFVQVLILSLLGLAPTVLSCFNGSINLFNGLTQFCCQNLLGPRSSTASSSYDLWACHFCSQWRSLLRWFTHTATWKEKDFPQTNNCPATILSLTTTYDNRLHNIKIFYLILTL